MRIHAGANELSFEGPLPTVGELAERTLLGFLALQQVELDVASGQQVALEFLATADALLGRFPSQTRRHLATQLPFSSLERGLLSFVELADQSTLRALTTRLHEWANRSPVVVDEVPVHAADFLKELASHLDTWASRQAALTTADRLTDGC